MKPLELQLVNFGPFLEEHIDFRQIEDNELFLISGKTGSGKTMLFDAMVYALFGEASTKDRKESDLRSHFADGKEPMTVTFIFELHNRQYKVTRQGPFLKEGNVTKTNAKLDVYEKIDNKFELRESKVTLGNQFIIDLLGVNADQFRQLFILPQGEFKRFLLSNSREKQGILRTLFNSEKYENIQNVITDDVKSEKQQIDNRYQQIDALWQSIDHFDDEVLMMILSTSSQQTEKILYYIPEIYKISEKILNEYQLKQQQSSKDFENIERKLNQNIELLNNIKLLEQQQYNLSLLKEHQNEIDNKKQIIFNLNEIATLTTYLDNKEQITVKYNNTINSINQSNKLIESINSEKLAINHQFEQLNAKKEIVKNKEEFINATQYIEQHIDKYKNSYQDIEQVKQQFEQDYIKQGELKNNLNQLNNDLEFHQQDYDIVITLTTEINNLNNNIKNMKDQLDAKAKMKEKQQQLTELQLQKSNQLDLMTELKNKHNSLDKDLLDLTNKEDFVNEIKAAVSIGEVCPICGNEINDLGEHIDFNSINKRRNDIKKIEADIATVQSNIAVKDNEIKNVEEQIANISINDINTNNLQDLQYKLTVKQQQLEQQQEINKRVENKVKQKESFIQQLHQTELSLNNNDSKLRQHRENIMEFKKVTNFDDISEFLNVYKEYVESIQRYHEQLDDLTKQLNEVEQKGKIEHNNFEHYQQQLNDYEVQLNDINLHIEQEQQRLNITSLQEIEDLVQYRQQKEQIQHDIDQYYQQLHEYEIEIKRLKQLTEHKELYNHEKLIKDYEIAKQQQEHDISELSKVQFQWQEIFKKIKDIEQHINYLNKELKEQQQIFQLSEILNGKNNKKLNLENYVLIYYLDKIITQANLRLANMTDNRYQLKRREAVSQGLSGLEIDVFDLYSNKSRHISSLSGGETFQSSLALALGLSEIVQQQAGGISLESIFIDEGFGTLDQETLETALDTLLNIKSTGRMVGIISHVSELKNRIPLILEVKANQYQSTTAFRRN
ncbi:SMC family ATPase [Staphylococcus simiae]|uniref:exonuclease subunit SbcC n=1 Tax=Staphylococcus simiae TaxID=308354 RepID=UPI001A976412|nr:exonuclease subunit SbcC [Staphylococcus simiae]MBO1199623.1 SMC family ATPase [Staphylococcus simiae]MBO1201940.1 SMC family ATPase [Staphylococcus simiae]MBO1204155.1 SMC family ATPase [Staphylococcus simiae]MBO1211659.1 SMC family ATPase [Staphylococcus simiae]MBO1230389.1 SMC family ATPase [Staphylococcus simiae]